MTEGKETRASSVTETSQPEATEAPAFEGMEFASYAPLRACTERTKCPRCGHPRKYFCYDCAVPLTEGVPRVALPLAADIVHYRTEQRSKSTSVHGVLLAPAHVRLVEYPRDVDARPAPYDAAETVVLYPAPDAVAVAELPRAALAQIRRVVLLDSQWSNAPRMLRHPALAGLRRVTLRTARTAFWRYQRHGQDHLATIEALYWFVREFAAARDGTPYAGQFDNLLWYFSFNYALIQEHYNKRRDRSFVHIKNYIRYKDGDSSEVDPHEQDQQQQPASKKPRDSNDVESEEK